MSPHSHVHSSASCQQRLDWELQVVSVAGATSVLGLLQARELETHKQRGHGHRYKLAPVAVGYHCPTVGCALTCCGFPPPSAGSPVDLLCAVLNLLWDVPIKLLDVLETCCEVFPPSSPAMR